MNEERAFLFGVFVGICLAYTFLDFIGVLWK